MAYVDLFVLPVPKDQVDRYFENARAFAKIWKAAGALSVIELRAEDAPMGKMTSFPQSVQLTEDETVAVGILTFRDRAHRDEVMGVVMSDPDAAKLMEDVPTDGKRMFFGGFVAEVEA